MPRILALLWICFFHTSLQAQPADGDSTGKKKIYSAVVVAAVADAAALTALGHIWYKDKLTSSFHFFNDYPQWRQVDKAGHAFTAFHLTGAGYHTFGRFGASKKQALIWAGAAGFLALSQIEALDGFSKYYGASAADLGANALGSAAAVAQYALWDEIRIHPKFSFHPTRHAAARKEVLGANLMEELIKNYNGQTYWVSFDMDKLLPGSDFPKWLNVALGYGAEEMLFGRDHAHSYRQYYVSLDFDFSSIKSQSKWINALLYGLNMIHLPAPALEFNNGKGVNFYWLYF